MMNKKNLTQMLKSIFRHQSSLRDYQIMHPARDWLIGVFLFITVFAATALYSVWIYLQSREQALNVVAERPTEVVVYRESLVAAALERLEVRSNIFESLISRADSNPVIETIIETEPTEEEDTEEITNDGLEEENQVEVVADVPTESGIENVPEPETAPVLAN